MFEVTLRRRLPHEVEGGVRSRSRLILERLAGSSQLRLRPTEFEPEHGGESRPVHQGAWWSEVAEELIDRIACLRFPHCRIVVVCPLIVVV